MNLIKDNEFDEIYIFDESIFLPQIYKLFNHNVVVKHNERKF